MDSSAQVDISLPFGLIDFDEARVLSRRSSIRCFLTGISKVRDITICRDTFKLIRQYSKSEPLPQFGYMSRVHITLCIFDLKWLPTFLESCANLKYLTLVWNGNYDDHRPNPRISFSSVPECVLSSLEIVDIKASITVCFPEMKVARISKVRDMTICRDTFKLIRQYSKLEPLPQFGYMSRLRVTLHVSDFEWLPTFLERCANLKSLILVWNGNSKKMYNDNRRISFPSVPECLLSSLEFIDFRTSISGYFPEMRVVRYFLENSAILKKLTLRLNYYCAQEKVFFKMLREIPRRSAACEVVVL
ncbi:hypothetical protein AALP_AA8G319400 [Arabis alpina]|uniref:FBD domain-containing protein n=1 Tax=Arabis alpina TaxID=50452 RepID=A0A087GAT3_ARAAL|nr:hypothetical protein AALP_AA8G319400 [Arabis alpina]